MILEKGKARASMADEREIHLHRGAPAERAGGKFCIPDDDTAPHISQCDDDALWTIGCYDDRRAKTLGKLGAQALPATHGAGSLYQVTAQQLIQFIAADAGINVDFPRRKKAQLSPAAAEARRARMRALNAAQRVASTSMNRV